MKITVHLEAGDIVRIITAYVQDNLHIQGQCEFTYTPSPLWVEVTQDEDQDEDQDDEPTLVAQDNIFTWIGKNIMTRRGVGVGKLLDLKVHSHQDSTFTLVTDSGNYGPVHTDGTCIEPYINERYMVCLK
jgi:hypothetical protein